MVENAKPGVNFEPYLQEGELRTSRDVLDWLDEYDGAELLGPVRRELRAQLHLERRQASMRGFRAMVREIAMAKKHLRYEYKRGYTFQDAPNGRRFDTFGECIRHRREQRWGAELRAALAFRAAARLT